MIQHHDIVLNAVNRTTTLAVYLPPSYATSTESYRVLIMHDGQNLFDLKASSYGAVWEIEERLSGHATPEAIIVGVPSAEGEGRLNEYGPFPITHGRFNIKGPVGGSGAAYIQSLIDDVLPYIHRTYRCLKGPENTALMGSSMGGVISVHAGAIAPHVFGRIASLSGAFYVSFEPLRTLYASFDFSSLKTLYMDTGDQEIGGGLEEDYLKSNAAIYDIITAKTPPQKHRYAIIPGGIHRETAWAERVLEIYQYLWS